MLFNSLEFAIFLPLVFVLYWFVFGRNLKIQNFFVLVVSYIFYGWWDWRFLILIAFTSLCSYVSGILIDHYRESRRKARIVGAINIIINLVILGTFKYYNFFVSEFANAFLGGAKPEMLVKLILPVGISFYTFQALSYSIDVYKRKLPATRDLVAFMAFISFFPQLVAGPIERATNLLPQFGHPRKFDYDKAVDGMRQILWGLFKKMVVADNCAVVVDAVFGDYMSMPASSLVMGAVFFTIQIYCDFSGYSDIAIGTARLFGFSLMRNFNFPYFSRNIAEFWRRWHISLTTWFRDYIYIPLGGSRGTKWQTFRNTVVIFLVSGLWHGANWTFILWGAYNVLLFILPLGKSWKYKYSDTVAGGRLFPNIVEIGQMLMTFILVVIGWVIFRSETIVDAVEYITRMFSVSLFTSPVRFSQTNIVLFSSAVLFIVEWLQRDKQFGLQIDGMFRHAYVRYVIYYTIVLAVILCSGKEQQFIYFQF